VTEPKIQSVTLNEKHRFLCWQPSHRECEGWADWFKKKGTEHVVAKNPDNKDIRFKDHWTIYKHTVYIDNRWNVAYCCDEYRKQGSEIYEYADKMREKEDG
jgi:ABC-type ATPase with predicted acetyltransferase domain